MTALLTRVEKTRQRHRGVAEYDGPAQLPLPGPGTTEGASLMQLQRTHHSGPVDILDAILTVQTAVEKTSTHTGPDIPVKQTVHPKRVNPVKGRKYPATPVYGTDADKILDALYTPEIHGVGKWSTRWGPHRQRNRTIMATARGTGARIHELLLLRLSDIDFETHQVVIRRGKNGKRRLIAILPEALSEIEAWLPVWEARGFSRTNDDLLFPVLEGPTKGGMLDQSYVRDHLHKAAKEAGVTVRATCHQWRHGLAVELHRRRVPIGIIQRQLGHSNPAITGIYLAGISAEEVIDTVVSAMAVSPSSSLTGEYQVRETPDGWRATTDDAGVRS